MKKSPSRWPDCYRPPSWLPDWSQEDEYSNVADFTEYRFDPKSQTAQPVATRTSKSDYAWEFLRRNPWYQADFRRIVELCEQEGVFNYYHTPLLSG
ncbi:transcriptional regulator domain-containing protein [Geobacter grbiciae]|uniref:transcriptional regulator domain-containing protein n=1 Tax=Geobacter grbiciae TaxID=155042 RepID=UPI003CCE9D0D